MAHIRSSIRNAVVSALTGLTTTGARVYPTRVHAVTDAELPCLLVYLDDEEISAASVTAPALLERRAELRITGLAKANSSLDATLDTILAEVEAKLGTLADPSLGGIVKSPLIPTAVKFDVDDSLEKPAGMATLSIPVLYFTLAGSPGVSV